VQGVGDHKASDRAKRSAGDRVDLKSEKGTVVWAAVLNKFFAGVLHALGEEGSLADTQATVAYYALAGREAEGGSPTWGTGVTIRTATLKKTAEPDGPAFTAVLDVFAGAKRKEVFEQAPLYSELDYKDTISLGACFCAWEPLSFGMIWLLDKLSVVALGNYGVAIILLVALVRLALHPLTKKGQVAMSKMQKLAPEMKKIQEKYKDDKQTLQREMMALYRQHGAGPWLGCLPMFIQLPIWIALWTGINASVSLRHAAFLPVWITDLAAPDALFDLPDFSLPLVGTIYAFNLLPILLCVGMVLQQKFSPSAGQGTEQGRQTQKMMMIFMPIFMLFIFYQAPSGLTLYIMTSAFAGAAEQYVIRKHIAAKEAEEAVRETRVQAPGKAPRSSRPKKPKGPNWFKHG